MWNNIKRIDDTAQNVAKFVFHRDDAVAEAVLYKYPDYKTRTVICCSTQSGCPVGCRFCGAGDYFVRSLTADEIVSQPKHLLDRVLEDEGTYAEGMGRLQIMFMSMGEPLLNLKGLIPALRSLYARYPKAALLISTSAPKLPAHERHRLEIAQLPRRVKRHRVLGAVQLDQQMRPLRTGDRAELAAVLRRIFNATADLGRYVVCLPDPFYAHFLSS